MRTLLRILIWSGLLVGLIVALAMFLLLATRNRLAGWGLTQIFKTPVEVQGTGLSWNGKARRLDVVLRRVSVQGTHPQNRETVFYIRRAAVELDPVRLWREIYRQDTSKRVYIPDIRASDCLIHFLIDTAGRRNFRGLFKGRKPREKRPELILLERLEAQNVSFIYEDLSQKRYYHYWMPESMVRIAIARDSVDFSGTTGGYSRLMRLAGYAFLEQTPFQAQARLTLHKQSKRLVFRPGTELTLDSTRINLTGDLYVSDPAAYDLRFEAREGRIQTLLNLLPHGTRDVLGNYELQGQLTLLGRLRGLDLEHRHPYLDIDFRCREVALRNRSTSIALDRLQLVGRYNNGSARNIRTTSVLLDTLSGLLGQHRIEARASLFDFRQLLFEAEFRARAEAADLLGWLGRDEHDRASGRLAVDLRCNGSLRRTDERPAWKRLNYAGRLHLEDLGFDELVPRVQVAGLQGTATLVGDRLDLPGLTGRLNGANLRLDLRTTGLVGRIFDRNERIGLSLTGLVDELVFDSFYKKDNKKYSLIKNKKTEYKPDLEHEARNPHPPPAVDSAASPDWASVLSRPLPRELEGRFDVQLRHPRLSGHRFERVGLAGQLRPGRLLVDRFAVKSPLADLNGQLAMEDGRHRRIELNLRGGSPSLLGFITESGLGQFGADAPKVEIQGRLQAAAQLRERQADLRFLFERGDVRLPERNIQITDLSARLRLNERHLHHFRQTPLELDSIRGRANEYPFQARVAIRDWTSQYTDLFVKTEIGADVLLNYFRVDNIDRPYGQMRIDSKLSGPLERFLSPEGLLKLDYSGRLDLEGLGFRFVESGLQCRNVAGRVDYDQREVRIRSIEGELGRSNFRLTARLKGVLDYLYRSGATLAGDGWFHCDSLDIQDLLRPRVRKRDTPYEFRLPRHLDLTAQVRLGRATFGELLGEHVELALRVQDLRARVDAGRMDLFGGSLRFDGTLDPLGEDSLALSARLFAQQLEISDALDKLDDLGQDFITHEQISGRFDGQIIVHDRRPRSFGYSLEHTRVSLNFQIADGVLADFMPVRVLDLLLRTRRQRVHPFLMSGRNLRFENGELHVPWLELRTLLFDVLVRGRHHTDGRFDYQLRALKGRRRVPLANQNKHLLPGLSRYENSLLAFRLRGDSDNFYLDYDPGPLRDWVLDRLVPLELRRW